MKHLIPKLNIIKVFIAAVVIYTALPIFMHYITKSYVYTELDNIKHQCRKNIIASKKDVLRHFGVERSTKFNSMLKAYISHKVDLCVMRKRNRAKY